MRIASRILLPIALVIGASAAAQAGQPAPVQRAAASTSFRPQPGDFAPRMLASEGKRTAAERAALEAEFTEALTIYRKRLRDAGGDQYDVARAATYLVAAAWTAYFDRPSLTPAQFGALRAQLHDAFLANPEFVAKSDLDKQIEFETYGILAISIDGSTNLYRKNKDPNGLARVKAMARSSFMGLMGVPPERMRLSESGELVTVRN